MIRRDTPNWFGWTFAIVLHLDLLLAAVLLIGDEDLDSPLPARPATRSLIVRSPTVRSDLPAQVEEPRGMFGRWPMNCDHGGPQKAVSIWDDRLGDGLRCEVCGWPWWVIRAMSRD
jgi:hypothetical protein